MCYTVSILEQKSKRYAERYKFIPPVPKNTSDLPEELPLYYFVSGFEHPLLPVVRHDGFHMHRWGLIPSWVRDRNAAGEIMKMTLNAVGEEVFEKASYKKSITTQRCLLGVSGFFEWMDLNKQKYPFYIQVKGESLFSLGCTWESWSDPGTGESLDTFSILTTKANPLMEKIHNIKKRMPLIIPRELEEAWVDPALSRDQIISLIKPFPEELMSAYAVSKNLNSPRQERNVPKSLEHVDYPELQLAM